MPEDIEMPKANRIMVVFMLIYFHSTAKVSKKVQLFEDFSTIVAISVVRCEP